MEQSRDKSFFFEIEKNGDVRLKIDGDEGTLDLKLSSSVAKIIAKVPENQREEVLKQHFISPLSGILQLLNGIAHISIAYPDAAYIIWPVFRSLMNGLVDGCQNLSDLGKQRLEFRLEPKGRA